MRYAFLSDIHGRRRKLEAVLTDAQILGVDQVVSLGDVGDEECLARLRKIGVKAVFGNYEVSGWRRLAPEYRAWVLDWPPLLSEGEFLAVHAVPWWPRGLQSTEDFGRWLKRTGRPWRALFPYLTEDEDYMWQALAKLENADKTVLFHGHTHRQAIWQWEPTGRLRRVRSSTIKVRSGHRYVVGVGSVGLPEDGNWAAYTLYDAVAGTIELLRLDQRSRFLPAS